MADVRGRSSQRTSTAHEAALAMQTKMFVGRLAQTTHAYPSWAMAVQLAAMRFFSTGRDGWRPGRGQAA
jgi:hypothetical protein